MVYRRIFKRLVLLAFVLLQVYLFFFHNFEVLDYSRYSSELYPQPLSAENRSLAQEFRTPGPLTRIDILLANYQVKPEGGTLQLGIFKKKRCLFLKKYPANLVEDNQFYRFAIDPASPIPGGHYSLQLKHFPTATKRGEKEKIAVWTLTKDIYPYGSLKVNGKQVKGDISFRVYYFSTIWNYRGALVKKIPSLWLSRYWLPLGLLLMLLAINFLFYYLVEKLFVSPSSTS